MDDMRSRRFGTIGLIVVAAVAAGLSFYHIVALGLLFHQPLGAALPLPVSVDGMILSCSMILYRAAIKDERGHRFAAFGLWTGMLATLAANVGYGVYESAGHGWLNILANSTYTGWPALAFVISAEAAILSARRSARTAKRATSEPVPATTPEPRPALTGRKRGAELAEFPAAVAAYRASVAAGSPLSERKLAEKHLGGNRHAAARAVRAAQNGYGRPGLTSDDMALHP